MKRKSTLGNRFLAMTACGLLLAATAQPAHATSKEIIQMQAQIEQLLDNVQRLQSTVDKGFAVMQNLTQQTADNANQMTAAVSALQKNIANENDALNGKLDANSGQIQSLNDSVDELKTRIAQLEKSIQDLQNQMQNTQAPPSGAMPAAGAMPVPGAMPGTGSAPAPAPALPAASQTPPLQSTFQAALNDYNAARFRVATGEFQDVIQYYPLDELAGASQYYLGEIAYRQQKYGDAIKAYNAVIEGFPGNAKAPAAQLHKGLALLKLGRRPSAIHELRLLIHRYPQTPEAALARVQLERLGARSGTAR
ncbi:MAG: tetratricopeptide repeat protein [Terracidiphilus sp.]